ncbi:hypothetical protein DFH27DRAFT_482341 [Peziza echinospora]|nr:hypothetical protein DFH27DRAFT_482341 [Peziza echinospora]
MFTLLAASLAFVTVTAHMHLAYPLPLNYYKVTDRDDEAYDWWIQKGAGPCLGQLGDYDSAPVELTWAAGSKQGFSLGGTSPHYGGSCQASLSYDRGRTFRVIKSFPGSCPHRRVGEDQDFSITIPADAPTGEALFSWSWFNREREMYHNCAKIKISGGGKGIDNLPLMLIANVGGDCVTPLTDAEVQFPNPGKDVETGDKEYPLRLPSGSCQDGFLSPI